MMDNRENSKETRENYRDRVKKMGKKEFTLLKMKEFGFWPENLPTPYERQKNESKEEYENRERLQKEYEKLSKTLSDLYDEKYEIERKLSSLRKEYDETWDSEKIRKHISKEIMIQSIKRRKERKDKLQKEKEERSRRWEEKKSSEIVYIGKGYSGLMDKREYDEEKLKLLHMPIIRDDRELAEVLKLDYKDLRFLVYHRDVVETDHYSRYKIEKRSGGLRDIAAPKGKMKSAQSIIYKEILKKVDTTDEAHGFIEKKSVITGAESHGTAPELVINMDIQDFFPTITFQRVVGMFRSFGYSGYVSSMMGIICTYCRRMEIEIKGRRKFVKTSERILPQGAPSSPMITNILCRGLDKRLKGLAHKYGATYSRYADDMTFAFGEFYKDDISEGKFSRMVTSIVSAEGFEIKKDKTKFQRPCNRQCVTGIVINNEKIGVNRKWVKNLRAEIFNGGKLKEQGKLTEDSKNKISGKISWLKSVNRERYSKIIEAGEKLLKD